MGLYVIVATWIWPTGFLLSYKWKLRTPAACTSSSFEMRSFSWNSTVKLRSETQLPDGHFPVHPPQPSVTGELTRHLGGCSTKPLLPARLLFSFKLAPRCLAATMEVSAVLVNCCSSPWKTTLQKIISSNKLQERWINTKKKPNHITKLSI